MPRITIEWRSASRENYISFCKKFPTITLTFNEWKNILYTFNDSFRNYMLETGDKARLPSGFGEFCVNKKKRKKKKILPDGREFINLPVDWKKTKEKGKIIYNMNFHTEGYFFGWIWFKNTARFKNVDLWYFKACRTTSRILSHYLKTDEKYQHKYKEWKQ